MLFTKKKPRDFFEELCVDYYEKVLRYLYGALGDETAAKDCVQDVFLTACRKAEMLEKHPNPAGFLFQTAKNLAQKARRESFRQMAAELSSEDDGGNVFADANAEIEKVLDGEIDETEYIEAVLSKLPDDKRELYNLYYLNGNTMAEVAAALGAEEPAVRMRYVRLRREIRGIVSRVAEESFDY